MKYSHLHSLGWSVSRICLGTVEFGMPYGFALPGELPVPDRSRSLRLLQEAFSRGINWLDTSPTYGYAEEIVGEALRNWGDEIIVAGKIPNEGPEAGALVERTLRRLRRDHLDILQIYSTTPAPDFRRTLAVARRLKEEGKARVLGITLYDQSVADWALQCEDLQIMQLPFNVLDQRMAKRIIPGAREQSRTVLARSPLMRGILTDRRKEAPPELSDLVVEADRLEKTLSDHDVSLAQAALSFSALYPGVSAALVGVRDERELREAIASVDKEPDLTAWLEYRISCAEGLLDPRRWSGN